MCLNLYISNSKYRFQTASDITMVSNVHEHDEITGKSIEKVPRDIQNVKSEKSRQTWEKYLIDDKKSTCKSKIGWDQGSGGVSTCKSQIGWDQGSGGVSDPY